MRQWTAVWVLLAVIVSASVFAQAPAKNDQQMRSAPATNPAFD